MGQLSVFATAVTLNQPGRYLHWSIFTVSVANLVLIAVMVVIFGVALLVPFPMGRHGDDLVTEDPEAAGGAAPAQAAPLEGDATMWTARTRRLALRLLPPGKLLPDRQPAYVASWIYVFGVAALAALALAIVSGFLIALGGPDWWHTNPVGHFFNSMHMWSVELFMALLVIHLWGKFWMAAWRGRRTATWITGVVAFLASIVECFTGYLSQQNFDSQWISTSAKDAFNASGVGAFFNAMNTGEMLLWHVVLIPVVLVAIVGAHILLVRVRGVSHPLPVARARGRAARRAAAAADAKEWRGPKRRYDIIKEATVAVVITSLLVVLLAAILSSPDVPAVTVSNWAKVAPADFMATTASELAGTSETATYGPPYNDKTGSTQQLLFSPEKIVGIRDPITAAQTFVLSPLAKIAPTDPAVGDALARYRQAPAAEQHRWDQAYLKAVMDVKFTADGRPVVPAATDGPVPAMVAGELTMARSGALDADLLAQQPFYGTNYTKPLLFLEDGEYFIEQATKQHLSGTQWGVMNESGGYPGQPWLWLYTLWYQVPGFDHSANVDLIAIYLTGVATLLLLAVPFIPGLRDVPRLVPVHRLVWRDWNRRAAAGAGPGPSTTAGPAATGVAGSGDAPPSG
jgi:hypothetical protein